MKKSLSAFVFLLLFVPFLIAAAGADEAPAAPRVMPKSIAVDTNKDGKPDRWESYENGKLAKIESDTNFDGKPDEWMTAQDGKPSKLEKDSDYDGKIDQWVTY